MQIYFTKLLFASNVCTTFYIQNSAFLKVNTGRHQVSLALSVRLLSNSEDFGI